MAIEDTVIGATTPVSGSFSSLTVDQAYSLPTTDGTEGEVLVANGSGTAAWGPPPVGSVVIAPAAEELVTGGAVYINPSGSISRVSSRSVGLGPVVTLDRNVGCGHISMAENDFGIIALVYTNITNDVGYVRIATPTSNEITFGTEFSFAPFTAGSEVYSARISFDQAHDCFIIVYTLLVGSTATGHAMVARLEGDAIVFGDPMAFGTTRSMYITKYPRVHCVFHASAGVSLIGYTDESYDAWARTATVLSDNSIALGAPTFIDSDVGYTAVFAYDPHSDVTLMTQREQVWVVEVSGGAVSVGAAASLGSSKFSTVAFIPMTGQAVVVYSSGDTYACVATVSGSTVSLGSPTYICSQGHNDYANVGVVYDSTKGSILIVSRDTDTDGIGQVWEATVSGDTVSIGSPTAFSASGQLRMGAIYSTAFESVILGSTFSDGSVDMRLLTMTAVDRLVSEASIGLATTDAAAGSNGAMRLNGGVVDGVSGLSEGECHYVQKDGTLSPAADSPAVLAGVALSSTELSVAASLSVTRSLIAHEAEVQSLSIGDYSLPAEAGLPTEVISMDPSGDVVWGSAGPYIKAPTAKQVSAGQPVILNRLGSLSGVNSFAAGLGPGADLGRAVSQKHTDMAEDSHGNILVVYVDVSGYGAYVRLVVPVGGNILYGPEVEFADIADEVYSPTITYDSALDCFVIVYNVKNGSTGTGHAVVIRVDGNTISVGASTSYGSVKYITSYAAHRSVYHASSGAIVIANTTTGSQGVIRAAIVDVTDTITFGSAVQFTSSCHYHSYLAHDPISGDTLLLYSGRSRLVSVFGDVVSFGAECSVGSAKSMTAAFDSVSHRPVVLYADLSNTYTCVGTVSGNTVTYGTPTIVCPQGTNGISLTYDEARGAMVIASRDNDSDRNGVVWVATVAGDVVSLSAPREFSGAIQYNVDVFYSKSIGAVLIAYRRSDTIREVRIFSNQELSSIGAGTYVGIAASSADEGDEGIVVTAGGVARGVYGLEQGLFYFVQRDGSLSHQPDMTVMPAGVALTETSICVGSAVSLGSLGIPVLGYQLPLDKGQASQVLTAGGDGETQWKRPDSLEFMTRQLTAVGDCMVLDSLGSVLPVVTTDQGLGTVTATFDNTLDSDYFSVAEDAIGNVVQVGRYGRDCALTVVSVFGGDVTLGSYETFTAFSTSYNCRYPTIVYHEAEDCFVVLFGEQYSTTVQGYVVAARLTDEGFVFGPIDTFDTLDYTTYGNADAAYDVGAEAVVFAYNDAGEEGYVVACAIGAGDAVECGTPVQHASDSGSYPALVYEPLSARTVLTYQDSSSIKARVVSVTSTVVTLGTPISVYASFSKSVSGTLDPLSHSVVVTFCTGSPYNVMGSILSVSGDTVSATTPVLVADGRFVTRSPVTYDPLGEKFYVAYVNESDSDKGTVLPCTIQGGDLVADGSPIVYADADQDLESMYPFYSSQARALLLYDGDGNVRTYTPESWSTLTGNTYVGVA
ncbi:hypothetical protein KIPB_008896, partial [Kipferlia bialata]|eukprot:g8896.t1